jgi:catechol 2,3-dioxygenase-like lactoylglutathione lyase family enzyme
MDRPVHAGLRHLALIVRDMDAMKRFYVDMLGFHIEWEPDPDNVYLSSGADNLALHRSAGTTPNASTSD